LATRVHRRIDPIFTLYLAGQLLVHITPGQSGDRQMKRHRRKQQLMRPLKYVVITTTLASAMIFAQAQTDRSSSPTTSSNQNPAGQADRNSSATSATSARTFTGTIVNADCSQASILTAPTSAADQTSANKDTKSVYDKQREILRHCRVNNNATAFAVLTDDGSFYKLDEAGNSQVKSQAGSDKEKNKSLKNMRVTVTGTPEGDTLKIQSLTKTDKPFGSV